MIKKNFLLTILAIVLFSVEVNAASSAFAQKQDDGWLETYNRSMFEFNYQVDRFVTKPLAKGYRYVTTQSVRNRVNDALYNSIEPLFMVNHGLQASWQKALNSVGRFIINTTLGLGGTFDVAHGWGLKKHDTGFDETFATWCIPDGPFFVLPILGPSTARLASASAAAFLADPVRLALLDQSSSIRSKYGIPYSSVFVIATREKYLDLTDSVERDSLDLYSSVKSAFLQRRQALNNICRPQNSTPSYDFDFDDDEEFEF